MIARAARLQREAREAAHGAVDVVEVAGELDIAPEYVEKAVELWEKERKEAQAREASARARRRRPLIGREPAALDALQDSAENSGTTKKR